MSTPAQQVFAIPELLEMVLCNLVKNQDARSMRTVLFAQRVNSEFRATIQGSHKLRRALWFEDAPSREPGLNPLIGSLKALKDRRPVFKFMTIKRGRKDVHYMYIAPWGVIDETTGLAIEQSWQKMLISKGGSKNYRMHFRGKISFFNNYYGDVQGAVIMQGLLKTWRSYKSMEWHH